MSDARRVMVLAPHPDDEAIGCGGTILRHVRGGDRVTAVFLTSGELGLKHLPPPEAWRVREGEAAAAAAMLGLHRIDFLHCRDWFLNQEVACVADKLTPFLSEQQPNVVYLPHPGDWHPDHQASLPILRAALSASGIAKPELLQYEVWTPMPGFDHVEDITTTFRQKYRAVRCYRSQIQEFRYDRAVRGLNAYRGALAAHTAYAEVFQYAE